MNMESNHRLIRLPEVQRLTGLGKTTLYTLERRGLFPRRRKLTSRASAWVEAEVISWIEALPVDQGAGS
jgi:prophage regulatory protein